MTVSEEYTAKPLKRLGRIQRYANSVGGYVAAGEGLYTSLRARTPAFAEDSISKLEEIARSYAAPATTIVLDTAHKLLHYADDQASKLMGNRLKLCDCPASCNACSPVIRSSLSFLSLNGLWMLLNQLHAGASYGRVQVDSTVLRASSLYAYGKGLANDSLNSVLSINAANTQAAKEVASKYFALVSSTGQWVAQMVSPSANVAKAKAVLDSTIAKAQKVLDPDVAVQMVADAWKTFAAVPAGVSLASWLWLQHAAAGQAPCPVANIHTCVRLATGSCTIPAAY